MDDEIVKAVTRKLLGIKYYWYRCMWCNAVWKATTPVRCPECKGGSVKNEGEVDAR
jgi:rubrerythrin